MDLIKSYLVSKENVLIQLKPPALPCVALMLFLLIPSVFTDHNLERNEVLGCHTSYESILEVNSFILLYFNQTLLAGKDLLYVYNHRISEQESFPPVWTDCLLCLPCECVFKGQPGRLALVLENICVY